MKRTGFKRKPTVPLKRSPLKRRTPLSKRGKMRKSVFMVPKWVYSIPPGAHGTNPTQKRLWKLTSDFVRISDFHEYGGQCASCMRVLESWTEGDCGHWLRWTSCNAYMKFHRMNLALQCKGCNQNSDGRIGAEFTKTMEGRYGQYFTSLIADENKTYFGEKLETHIMVSMMTSLLEKFQSLPEIPEYVRKTYAKYNDEELYQLQDALIV